MDKPCHVDQTCGCCCHDVYGTFSAMSMLNAGFAALCGNATVSLIEKDGDPGKAMDALSKSDLALDVARSMVTAGLVGELSTQLKINPSDKTFSAFAQRETLRSAVNTVIAVTVDQQNLSKALLQGATSAVLNTVSAYGASKIGDLQKSKDVNWLGHKALHGMLGATTGYVVGHEKGALSGALGAVIGETTAELTGSKLVGDLTAVSVAMMADLDPSIAYRTSNNATTYNFEGHQEESDDEIEHDEGDGSLTPRSRAGNIALEHFDELPPSYIEQHENITREDIFQAAYDNAEMHVVIEPAWKGLTKEPLSDYQAKVLKECGTKWAIGKVIDQVVCKGVPVFGLGLKSFRKVVKHEMKAVSGKIMERGKKLPSQTRDYILKSIDKDWISKINLCDLLTHQSGLNDFYENYNGGIYKEGNFNEAVDAVDLLKSVSLEDPDKK
jgi:hypothetical protein